VGQRPRPVVVHEDGPVGRHLEAIVVQGLERPQRRGIAALAEGGDGLLDDIQVFRAQPAQRRREILGLGGARGSQRRGQQHQKKGPATPHGRDGS
jgi:hypothetical protein